MSYRNLLYVVGNGIKVKKKGRRIEISQNGKRIISVPPFFIDGVVVEGNNFITLPLMRELLGDKKICFFLTSRGKIWGVFSFPFSQNVVLRRAQYKAHFSGGKSLYLAKCFVKGKIANSRSLLLRLKREGKIDTSISDGVDKLYSLYSDVLRARTKDEVFGIEGMAGRIYFFYLKHVLSSLGFEERNKRPPRDPANALLSFAYTLLQIRIFSSAIVVGFDPYIGFLHSHKWGKPSLVLDMMEEFRFFAERTVIASLGKGIIGPDSFLEDGGRVILKDESRRRFIEFWESKMKEEIRHPFFNYRVSWARIFELQRRILAKYLMGEIEGYAPFRWK